MLDIKKLELGLIKENCYLVETDDVLIVIDPGYFSSKILDFFNSSSKDKLILITHAHFDHIGAVCRLQKETGAKICVCASEKDSLNNSKLNLSDRFHENIEYITPDILINDDEIIKIGNSIIKAIKTPGHTIGSVCYLIENNLFSGDTVFRESFGRTDFPGGDTGEMMESFYKLCSMLDDSVVVYPGHGETTTIGHEREENPLNFWGAI